MTPSSHNLAQRVFRGGILITLGTSVSMIIGFLIMPMVVNHLGDRLFGIWTLSGTLLGYFGFLDIGISKAVTRFVSQAIGQNDDRQVNKWITAALFSFSCLSILGILLSISIWRVTGHLFADPQEAKTFPLVFLISGLAFSVTLPSRCFTGIIAAHVKQGAVSVVTVVTTLLRSGVIVWTIASGYSLVALVTVNAVATIVQAILTILVSYRIHGPIQVHLRALQKTDWKTFLDYALVSFASQIADIARSKSPALIIASLMGPAAITPFAVAERVYNSVVSIFNQVLANLTPAFSQFEGEGGGSNNETLNRSYFFSYKIASYMGTFLIGILILLSESFIERWMGIQHMHIVPLLRIMLLGGLFAIIQIPTVCLLFAVSRQKYYAYSNSFHAMLSISLCLLLAIPYKTTGAVIGIAVAMFLVKLFIQPIGAARVLGISLWRYHLQYTTPYITLPLLYIAVYSYLAKGFCQPDYLAMALVAIVGALFFAPYIYAFGFSHSERRVLLSSILPTAWPIRGITQRR